MDVVDVMDLVDVGVLAGTFAKASFVLMDTLILYFFSSLDLASAAIGTRVMLAARVESIGRADA